MLEETHDNDQIIQRVAALDIGKAELTCCVRVPGQSGSGRRLQEVRTYQTMTRWLLVLADRLGELGVTRVEEAGPGAVGTRRAVGVVARVVGHGARDDQDQA